MERHCSAAPALDTILAITNKEATTNFSNEEVDAILPALKDRVLNTVGAEERFEEIVLHDPLREAVSEVIEAPDLPWSEVSFRKPLQPL